MQLAGKMGLDPAMVVHSRPIGAKFTFFVVYGRVGHLIDLSQVQVAEREYPLLSAGEVDLAPRCSYRSWSAERTRSRPTDAVLVSQVVTQKDAHLRNTAQMSAAFRVALGERRPLLVVGSPRFEPRHAAEIGVDRVFGRGTTPGEVASYLVHALAERKNVADEPDR